MLVQPQPTATVCELDLVRQAIRSSRRAQTLDPNQRWGTANDLNPTLDFKRAHVSSHLRKQDQTTDFGGLPNLLQLMPAFRSFVGEATSLKIGGGFIR